MTIRNLSQLFTYLLVLSSLTMVACSKEEDTSSSSSESALVSGVSTINSKLNSTADLIATPAADSFNFVSQSAGLHTVWTTANGVSDLSNTGSSTLQDWLGDMFNPDFVNSNNAKVTFAGRISNAVNLLCFLGAGNFTTDSTGLPEDGTHSLLLTAAILSSCGESGTDMVGVTATITASTLATTTIYDKAFSVTFPGSESCPFKFQVKSTSTELNIATAEDQSCDSRDQASRSVVRYNISAQTFRFTYISQAFSGGPSGFEFYRGYLNETTDEAYVLGMYGGDAVTTAGDSNNLDGYVAFSAAGKPSVGGTVAVSVKIDNQAGIADNIYNGCVNSSTGAITSSSDTLVCTLGAGADMTTSWGEITTSYEANTQRSDIYNINATTDVGFTDDSDMF
ncbi:MAG: hypothetical protein KDD40_06020 [Bdellovibrionales bacterium]|nr:hypothetical protein [Bdellovibrionales bacterium]